MEIKEVIGDSTPQRFEALQGGTLLNTDVQEVLIEDAIKYKYKQIFVTETNEEKLEKLFNVFTIKIHKDYLEDTDYLYPRFLETGEPVPEDVVLKRKEARDFLRANS